MLKHSRQLKTEIEAWVAEKIISRDQADQLIRRYELDAAAPWYRRTDFILRALAILLAAMGLLLVISQNWHLLPIGIRSAIGLVPLLVSYLLGWLYLRQQRREPAELSFFLASLLFGVNIFLQAQIFHISAYYPDGILWWIIGALPFAILMNSRLHHGLAEVLYYFWISQQLEYQQFTFTGAVLILTLFLLMSRSTNPLLFLLFYLNGFLFLYNLNQHLLPDTRFFFWVLLAGYSLAIWRTAPLWKESLSGTFLRRTQDLSGWIIVLVIFLATFSEFNAEFIKLPLDWAGVLLLVVAMAISPTEPKWHDRAVAALAGIFVAFHLAAVLGGAEPQGWSRGIAIAANLVLLGFAVYQIFAGIRFEEKKNFMSGVFIVALLAFARYLDFFDSYLLTGLILIAASILIYGLNQYWNRRYGT